MFFHVVSSFRVLEVKAVADNSPFAAADLANARAGHVNANETAWFRVNRVFSIDKRNVRAWKTVLCDFAWKRTRVFAYTWLTSHFPSNFIASSYTKILMQSFGNRGVSKICVLKIKVRRYVQSQNSTFFDYFLFGNFSIVSLKNSSSRTNV